MNLDHFSAEDLTELHIPAATAFIRNIRMNLPTELKPGMLSPGKKRLYVAAVLNMLLDEHATDENNDVEKQAEREKFVEMLVDRLSGLPPAEVLQKHNVSKQEARIDGRLYDNAMAVAAARLIELHPDAANTTVEPTLDKMETLPELSPQTVLYDLYQDKKLQADSYGSLAKLFSEDAPIAINDQKRRYLIEGARRRLTHAVEHAELSREYGKSSVPTTVEQRRATLGQYYLKKMLEQLEITGGTSGLAALAEIAHSLRDQVFTAHSYEEVSGHVKSHAAYGLRTLYENHR